jgi:hypothetical protein
LTLRQGQPPPGPGFTIPPLESAGLREDQARERGQLVLDALLAEIERLNRLLLTDKERRALLRMVEGRVVVPLAVYYRGVGLLWLGDYTAAEACFETYLYMLPGASVWSRAHALLKRARGEYVSAPVDNPYSTAALEGECGD